jgi:hypothetical protein
MVETCKTFPKPEMLERFARTFGTEMALHRKEEEPAGWCFLAGLPVKKDQLLLCGKGIILQPHGQYQCPDHAGSK